ncbi:hypothetical protein OG897_32225 [Streptomyces sp. NBC_00237]|uniref:hypothetical protein n=1 Tax=Streptomyces sp. NBC_00237 TaxID=2975687 RepID=UPI00225C2787|nr:hypothetical protein [Streptomyces sp. NBC_00237]MCX5206070.1 hypothetical protein [Streptomyces sp. NBC_00237]
MSPLLIAGYIAQVIAHQLPPDGEAGAFVTHVLHHGGAATALEAIDVLRGHADGLAHEMPDREAVAAAQAWALDAASHHGAVEAVGDGRVFLFAARSPSELTWFEFTARLVHHPAPHFRDAPVPAPEPTVQPQPATPPVPEEQGPDLVNLALRCAQIRRWTTAAWPVLNSEAAFLKDSFAALVSRLSRPDDSEEQEWYLGALSRGKELAAVSETVLDLATGPDGVRSVLTHVQELAGIVSALSRLLSRQTSLTVLAAGPLPPQIA